MISKIVVPSMGATGDDVVVAEWLVKEGDRIQEGQPIFVAETDKATTEVEAFRGGYLRRIVVTAGQTAAIGDVLAIIADSMDEPLEEAAQNSPLPDATCGRQPERGRILDPPRLMPAVSKRPRWPVIWQSSAGSIWRPSGSQGRSIRSMFCRLRAESAGGVQRIPLCPCDVPLRCGHASKAQAPHFYVTARVDMTEAQSLQRKLASQSEGSARPTITDLVIRAVAWLRETPSLTPRWKTIRSCDSTTSTSAW